MNTQNHGDTDVVIAVGVGREAVASLERFLSSIRSSRVISAVLVVTPDPPSHLVERVLERTGVKLCPVVHGARIERGAVYLGPAGEDLAVRDGRFMLSARRSDRPARPLDHWFRSFALEYAERSIAVVLAGPGDDGTAGVVAVRTAGGLVLAEDTGDSSLASMPQATRATGTVECCCAVEEMLPALLRFAAADPDDGEVSAAALDVITSVVGGELGVDLSVYRPEPLLRRIERRRLATGRESLAAYAALLTGAPAERAILARGLLPGVTRFFRDPEVFDALREAMPELARLPLERGESTLRCWVPACSTGEEAYSVAMCIDDYLERASVGAKVTIFATDIDERALEVGARGTYSPSSAAELPPRWVDRYLVPREDGYAIVPRLRESIVFARHDVLCDRPFSKIDFVSCRNMLIYLKQDAQKRAVAAFQFALRRGGHLLLGKGEVPVGAEGRFEPVGAPHRLYRLHAVEGGEFAPMRDLSVTAIRPVAPGSCTAGAAAVRARSTSEQTRALESLLHWVGKPVLVVDGCLGLMFAFGEAASLLSIPSGRAVWTIQDLLPASIAVAIVSVVSRAQQDREEIAIAALTFEHRGAALHVDVRAVPLHRGADAPVAVIFERLGPSEQDRVARTVTLHDAVRDRVEQLEFELGSLRERLETTVGQLEASREELRTSNEELVASNEELHRTNEELQALNHELHAVNAELQSKVDELSELSDDLDNLLQNTETGTLFLDPEGRVRRFNDPIRDVIVLRKQDIGRPIGEVPTRMLSVDLNDDVKRVMLTLAGIEREVGLDDGRTYVLRIYPFRTRTGAIDGVVIAVGDISSLAEANRRLQVYSRVAEQSPALHVFTDAHGQIEYANPAYAAATGWRVDDLRGTDLRHHLQPGDPAAEEIRRALESGNAWAGTIGLRTVHGVPIGVRSTVYALREQGQVVNLVLTGEIMPRVSA